MAIEDFYKHYEDNGFNFSRKILTRYCLSLYTKPFVILSGLSGTGKTKIAQLFNILEPEEDPGVAPAPGPAPVPIPPIVNGDHGYVIMTVTAGARNGDGRGNFKYRDLAAVYEPTEIPVIQDQIAHLLEVGGSDNINEPSLFTIETEHGEFLAAAYLQRASSPLLRVRFCSKRGDEQEYDSRLFLQNNYNVGDKLLLQKIGVKRFRVVSVNDEQIITLDNTLQVQEEHLIDNKLFVPVKSNWTDSSELFGFYNLLDEKYHITKVLKFIMTANDHPNKSFFLILDEMNLSKVEYYFSDFLSCLESRYLDDGELVQEGVNLHNYPSYVPSNDNYYDVVPNNIKLPRNLYVTGTVNIDETTYMFSPKVLDRANVIEFNTVDLSSYGDELPPNTETFVLTRFPSFGNADIPSMRAYTLTDPSFKTVCKDLLSTLQPYNLHFGYRVINEMSMFINNVSTHINNSPTVIEQAIDIQISQKILPKFNGSYGKLDEPLKKLLLLLIGNPALKIEEITLDFLKTFPVNTTKYPLSIAKLIVMSKALQNNGFTSYLE